MGETLRVNGKLVGELEGTTLIKRGKQVVRMHTMDGYGVSQSLVLDPRIEKIELHSDDKIYVAPVGMLIEKGIPYHRQPYEPQFILPTGYWSVRDRHQTEIFNGN